MSKTVSLVLSSGGARGYAHIGVIEALIEAGFDIRAIVGSSMGALVGGLYANKTLQDYKEWVLTLEFLDILRLVDFSFSEAGVIKGDRVFDKMSYLLGDVNIEDLPIDYTAVATDLTNGREFWFQRGSLRQAIRASIAIPMVFTPVRLDGKVLVDGGVLNPLPVAPTVSHHTDLVIAVNVNGPHNQRYAAAALPVAEQDKQATFLSGVSRFFASVGWSGGRKDQLPDLRLFEVMNQTFDTLQRTLTNYKIAGYPPDVVIDVPADACSFYDFHKAYEMIQLGRTAADQVLQTLASKSMVPASANALAPVLHAHEKS